MTQKYSAALNGTKMDTERQAYAVGNKISNEFATKWDIDVHIRQNYSNLNDTLIPKQNTE